MEDNESDEALALRAIKKLDPFLLVRVARDGSQAVDFLSLKPMPRLVLLDLKLPRLSGFEVLDEIRSKLGLPNLPVVALSSSDVAEDVERCRDRGANGYVMKPVDYHEYNMAVSSIVSYWLGDVRTIESAPEVSRFTYLP